MTNLVRPGHPPRVWMAHGLLFLLLAATGFACEVTPSSPISCERVDARVQSLAAGVAPAALTSEQRLEMARAALAARRAPACEALSEAERACQLGSETLEAALACVRDRAEPLAPIARAEDVPVGPTSAPPLPLPRQAGGAR